MQLTAAMFSDPSMRPQLEQYYEHKKATAIDALKAREADPSYKATMTGEIKMPDGTTRILSGNLFTAEMAEKSFASFDDWMKIQETIFDSSQKRLDMAQKHLAMLEQQTPDTSSGVRTTFSADGALLAAINADGTLMMSNGAEKYLKSITDKADKLGLNGQARTDYLTTEIEKTLVKEYNDLNVTNYTAQTSPTKREFADLWYKDFDVDQHYNDALIEMRASYESAKSWHNQWQRNLAEMQSFLIGLQEAA